MTFSPRPARAISSDDRHPIPSNGAVNPFLPLQELSAQRIYQYLASDNYIYEGNV